MKEKLAAQRIFANVAADTIDSLCRAGRALSLRQGDLLIREGESIDSIYCLLKGEVDVLIPDDPEGLADLTLVNMLVDGECIGEYSFIDRQPASATVRATTDTELLELPHDLLRRMLDADPTLRARLYQNLLESLVERLRNSNVYIDYLRRNKPAH